MQIHSSIGRIGALRPGTLTAYQELDLDYQQAGFTYKANQILHKTAENHPRNYPYSLLLYISKIFHLNQFQIIFLSHILNDVEPCYNSEPDLFNDDIEISQEVSDLLQQVIQIQNNNYNHSEQFNIILKASPHQYRQGEEVPQLRSGSSHNLQELKRVYAYLLVLGYAVKYYLNEQTVIKPYDQEIRSRHPSFFGIFNKWAKKYGNTALATTPRRINAYYLGLASQLQVDDNPNPGHNEQNCQYRNYNEIVQQLIKATTEGEDLGELQKQVTQE